jgi:hypothetical protein
MKTKAKKRFKNERIQNSKMCMYIREIMNEKRDEVEVEIARDAMILNDPYNITFNDSENISQEHTHISSCKLKIKKLNIKK